MSRRALVGALAGTAGTHLGLRAVPRARRAVGPLDVSAHVTLSRHGGTHLDVPPLGTATLATHRGPLRLDAQVVGLDPDRGQALLAGSGNLDRARDQLAGEARRLVVVAAVRAAAGALVGALTTGALTGAVTAITDRGARRPSRAATTTAAASAAAAAATITAATVTAVVTRNADAWRDPRLDGLLARAPLILGDLQQAPQHLERYRDQLAELIATGTAVYRRVAELPEPPPDDAIRIVHISDIHLSPLAFPLAKSLVEQYAADLVVDTGDLVDWGTPAEQALAGQIPSLGVPYVYVKGNHDSAGIAAAVARQPNAFVLDVDTGPRTVAGLTFVGIADPRFTPDKTTGDDHAPHRVRDAGRALAARLREDGTHADIALVHGPAAARALADVAPLVFAGDIHRRDARRFGTTTLLVQGSSGGSGLRGVQVDPPAPVMLSVYFLDRVTKALWGADEITLDGLSGTGLRIVRRTAAELLDGDLRGSDLWGRDQRESDQRERGQSGTGTEAAVR